MRCPERPDLECAFHMVLVSTGEVLHHSGVPSAGDDGWQEVTEQIRAGLWAPLTFADREVLLQLGVYEADPLDVLLREDPS